MKKKITLITSILLIIALAVTFVGCNKDKTEETPTTTEKVSTTELTTKFEAPEIKDEPTTEKTTEATTEPTTKKPVYNPNSGSSSGSGSSNSGSGSSNSGSNSKPASTTKASSNDILSNATDNGNGTYTVTLANGGTIQIGTGEKGGHGDASVYETDPDVIEAEGAHNGR